MLSIIPTIAYSVRSGQGASSFPFRHCRQMLGITFLGEGHNQEPLSPGKNYNEIRYSPASRHRVQAHDQAE